MFVFVELEKKTFCTGSVTMFMASVCTSLYFQIQWLSTYRQKREYKLAMDMYGPHVFYSMKKEFSLTKGE